MVIYKKLEEVMAQGPARTGYDILNAEDGLLNGCKCGISNYTHKEYDPNGGSVHDDQEGFFVLEGKGYALIDGEEIEMTPGACFMVLPGTKHTMKCAADSDYCRVFWFHAR